MKFLGSRRPVLQSYPKYHPKVTFLWFNRQVLLELPRAFVHIIIRGPVSEQGIQYLQRWSSGTLLDNKRIHRCHCATSPKFWLTIIQRATKFTITSQMECKSAVSRPWKLNLNSNHCPPYLSTRNMFRENGQRRIISQRFRIESWQNWHIVS